MSNNKYNFYKQSCILILRNITVPGLMEEDQEVGNKMIPTKLNSTEDESIANIKLTR